MLTEAGSTFDSSTPFKLVNDAVDKVRGPKQGSTRAQAQSLSLSETSGISPPSRARTSLCAPIIHLKPRAS